MEFAETNDTRRMVERQLHNKTRNIITVCSRTGIATDISKTVCLNIWCKVKFK